MAELVTEETIRKMVEEINQRRGEISPPYLVEVYIGLDPYEPNAQPAWRGQLSHLPRVGDQVTLDRTLDRLAEKAGTVRNVRFILKTGLIEDCGPVMSSTAAPQPAPIPGTTRIVDLVMADLAQRAETGRIKYGCYLQSHNGRNALIDAYQEALDLCMYLRQAIEENPPK